MDYNKLAQAIRDSEHRLSSFRANRKQFLDSYAGPYYAKNNSPGGLFNPVPINSLWLIVNTLIPNLVTSNPKAKVRLKDSALDIAEYKWEARKLSIALNHLFNEINFSKTLRTAIIDSLFGIGIIKTGINAMTDKDSTYLADAGQPYASTVDIDDFIVDVSARSWEEAGFIGNRYRVRKDWALDSGLYDNSILEDTSLWQLDTKKTESISATDESALIEHIELIDLWMPYENVLLTIPAEYTEDGKILREGEYIGPERGPYTILSLHDIPNNILPVPPVSIWYDMYKMINKLAAKAGRRADRSKSVILYDEAFEEDAQTIRKSSDGDMIASKDPSRFQPVLFGGDTQDLYANLAWILEQQDKIAGGINLLGGVEAASKTLGQDQILMANSNLRINDLRTIIHESVKEVTGKLAWYLTASPNIRLPLTVPLTDEDNTLEIKDVFDSDLMEGDFLDYNYDIIPYSLTPDSPVQKYNKMLTIVQSVMPVLPLAAQQGLAFDVERFIDENADLLDVPELKKLFYKVAPVESPAQVSTGAQSPSEEEGSSVDAREVRRERTPEATPPSNTNTTGENNE